MSIIRLRNQLAQISKNVHNKMARWALSYFNLESTWNRYKVKLCMALWCSYLLSRRCREKC